MKLDGGTGELDIEQYKAMGAWMGSRSWASGVDDHFGKSSLPSSPSAPKTKPMKALMDKPVAWKEIEPKLQLGKSCLQKMTRPR